MEDKLWLTVKVLVALALTSASSSASSGSSCGIHSNIGKNFFLGLPYVYLSSSNYYSYHKFIIYIAATHPGRVVVDAPASKIHKSLHVQEGGTKIVIPYTSIQVSNNTVMNYGIHLQSDVDIAVSLFTTTQTYDLQATASFIVLPVSALSKDYTVATHSYGTSYVNSFLVVATEDNTTISMTFPDINGHQFLHKRSLQVSMNQGYTYMFSNVYDLSNVRIQSNNPIAVISSSQMARIPGYTGSNSESIAEFVPPNTFGGYNFIVPALAKRAHYVIRVFAIDNSTTVTFRNYSSLFHTNVYTDLYDEYLFGDDAVVIQSNKPIMVYQYSTSYGYIGENKGTFMRNIPAIENYVTDTNFVIQDQNPEIHNYVQVIFPHSAVVLLDNLALGLNAANGHVMHDYTVSGQRYSVVTFSVPESADTVHGVNGYHRIHSQYGNARFAVLLSGYNTSRHEAYGLPLGLQSTGCHSSSGGTLPSTIAPTHNGTSHIGVNGTKIGPYCLQCDDLSHLFLCDTFTRCSSSEACYVERYTISNNEVRYRSGCKLESQCAYQQRDSLVPSEIASPRQTRATTCRGCCGGDFCNHRGCGGEEIPSANRGPFCLSCHHVLSIDECKTVSICQSNEVCSIEVSDFGIYRQYKMGCKPIQMCHSKRRNIGRRGTRRSNVLCNQCCSHDFCNYECHSGAPAIIG